MQRLGNYVGGELLPPAGGAWLDNFDPSIGRAYSQIPDSDASDVERAVDAAERAFPAWSALSPEQRSQHLLKVADGIERRLDELALAECIDNGKPLSRCRSVDIPRAIQNFRFFATAILHERSDLHITDRETMNYTLRRPRGVAGLISAWNLPLYLLTWKIAPALATGNTAVAKPSEVTPMTAFLLSKICIDAGLPPGVLNIVHGTGARAGAALVAHPNVPAISFTGGTATGRAISTAVAPMFKKVSLEMGGKNPTLVFADADPALALETSLQAAFANQGQICLCGSRLLVQREIVREFTERFVARAAALKVGDPLDPSTQQGAIVWRAHLEKIEQCVQLAREVGGRVLCGGKRPSAVSDRCRDGYFFEPTVIEGLSAKCRTNQEEIFGPVVTIIPFDDEREAIEIANSTAYGLSASIFTRDLRRAHRTAEAVEAGTVWINCWLVRDLRTPFGGVKQSGLGREGGDEALRFFTEPKTICLRNAD